MMTLEEAKTWGFISPERSNFEFTLKNGKVITTMFPEIVLHDWPTPWLDKPGCRQTCNPMETWQKGSKGYFVIMDSWEKWSDYVNYASGTMPRFQITEVASIKSIPLTDEQKQKNTQAKMVMEEENRLSKAVTVRDLENLRRELMEEIRRANPNYGARFLAPLV